MENASRALIIVGSMLIALIVLSLLVWGWSNLSRYNQKVDNAETVKQINKKNKEFESYNKKVVRGYELVSLANLIEDTNTRFAETDGYKTVEAYVKFLDNTTVINAIFGNKTSNDKIKMTKSEFITGNGINLNRFMTDCYNVTINGGDRDFAKVFKESYFECNNIIYNGEETGDKGTALVQKLYFTQILRNE